MELGTLNRYTSLSLSGCLSGPCDILCGGNDPTGAFAILQSASPDPSPARARVFRARRKDKGIELAALVFGVYIVANWKVSRKDWGWTEGSGSIELV